MGCIYIYIYIHCIYRFTELSLTLYKEKSLCVDVRMKLGKRGYDDQDGATTSLSTVYNNGSKNVRKTCPKIYMVNIV